MTISDALTQHFEVQSKHIIRPDTALFLGVGDASSEALGNSACLLLHKSRPWLLIDCGHDTLNRYKTVLPDELPESVFITHLHYDHVGGLEQLYFKAAISGKTVRLYVPALLVTQLCAMLRYTKLAELKSDVWHTFILHPVSEYFWHQGVKVGVYPVRHHAPNSAFGLHISGVMFYSGDTRPIPELLLHVTSDSEIIFHDCAVKGNPSHSGIDDLLREYPSKLVSQLWVYHYHSEQDIRYFERAGIKYVTALSPINLP
ncbi:MBL fold metallo-hydrolase [Pseudoalteromonas luteoviolacea]|uniref:MBL fold metallo-hydrolase n=1 Tax=Pseudoalteromonas luteoviolacea TaxID=43657 RepID=UPI00069AF673|nr:MBL fold metallo-hydrolase [Pseudoalteromonas luteoviolacea]AOT11272.1 ribonuclease Z [Pseudoalteromonas luteoviolacea]AOT16198.1 ribonuclease Z [Pseudoalteromonas luteoviolacea]AOT21101.1 ribonuclease Z [Pseudoalteromonas luteoviolacea]